MSDARRETMDASHVSRLTPPRVSCLASRAPWPTVKLSSICSRVVSGGTPSTKHHEYYGGNIPWLRTQEIDFKPIYSTELTLSEEGLNHSAAKWIPANSVIVAMYGATAGRSAITKIPLTTNQACCNLVIDENKADYGFVFYSLKLRDSELEGLAKGSGQTNLNAGIIKSFEIPLPPLSEQRRIVGILSAYDDLIENNRKRIALLEESARSLYKEWFVRLRFPGHERHPVEDGVPKGWKRRCLPDMIEINPLEARPKTKTIRYVPMSALSTTGMTIDLSETELRESSTSVRFRNEDTLLARITPCLENGKTGYAGFLDKGEVACGSTEFIVLRGRTVPPSFVYCLARTDDFRETAIKSMVGSSGRQRVQPACFDEYPVLEPDRAVLKQFDRLAEPVFAQIKTLRRESEKLAAARDALLPRLMKGGVG